MRAQFLAGQAPLRLAGKTWTSDLKALSPDTTPAQVALIDQPFAAARTKLDDQLLNFGATGTAGAAIAAFVHADENPHRRMCSLAPRKAARHSAPGRRRSRKIPGPGKMPPPCCRRPSGCRPRAEPIKAHPGKGARTGPVQSAAANQDMHRPAVYRSAPQARDAITGTGQRSRAGNMRNWSLCASVMWQCS